MNISPHAKPKLRQLLRAIRIVLLLALFPADASQTPEISWWKGGHLGSINAVVFSPDNQIFASSGSDGTIKLWRSSDGSLLRTLKPPGAGFNVGSLCFSLTGETLVSFSGEICHVWRIPDGALQRAITNSLGGSFFTVSRDASLVAATGGDVAAIYQTADGSLSMTITNVGLGIRQGAFSPAGDLLAINYSDSSVVFWQLADGTQRHSWAGWYAGFIRFSPDGESVMGGGGSGYGYLRLLRISDGQSLWPSNPAILGTVYAAEFSPDGEIIASGASRGFGVDDPAIRLWRVSDGTLLRTMQIDDYSANHVGFAPDGSCIASAGYLSGLGGNVIRFWNVSDGSMAHTLTSHHASITAVAFSGDGGLLASGGNGVDRTVRVWRTSDGSHLQTLRGLVGDATGLAFSPDDSHVIGCDNWSSPTIRSWRVSDGGTAWEVSVYPWYAYSLAGSPTSNVFAIAELYYGLSGTAKVELRRFSDGQLITTISNFNNHSVKTLSFSPDGTLLASGSSDGTVKLWQVPTTNLVRNISVGSGVNSVAFSPDGTLLATGSSNHLAKIWRTSDGGLQRTLSGHQGVIIGVVFSPDGRNLLSAGTDRTLRIWRVDNGALLTTYDSEVLQVISLAGSTRKRFFAYGRADATLVCGRWPTPIFESFALDGDALQFQLHCLTGQVYSIQRSTNMLDWNDWVQIHAITPIHQLSDSNITTVPSGFYRAIVQ